MYFRVPKATVGFSRKKMKFLRVAGGDFLKRTLVPASTRFSNIIGGFRRGFSASSEDPQLNEFMAYLDNLKNYEKTGVPAGAGTDSDEGFDLGRMKRLMASLGNPQSKFKSVHIAGTKGKGSTAAFLSNILRAEGYSVGCYTSPHVRTIRERMSLGRLGEPVSAKALNDIFKRVRTTIDQAVELEKGCISHFEVFTAIAFGLFAEENVDIAIIEAGLGGARDATNVISSSELAASVITTIGEEHLAALGGSVESIAMAKSGIVKTGRPEGEPWLNANISPLDVEVNGFKMKKLPLHNSEGENASINPPKRPKWQVLGSILRLLHLMWKSRVRNEETASSQ